MPRVNDFDEGYRANEFVLVIDGVESPSVSKVSGLSEGELDTIEQPDGGSGHVYKLAAAKMKFEPLTIERRVDGSADDKRFLDWFHQTFRLNAPRQGGSSVRKNGMIVKRHFGEVVLQFAFYGAWVKSSKFTDLEAGSTNLFLQTLVLEHEGLERVS
ncbi:phage tail protein [Streptomyces xylophagus]|uniref:phage tail protein n=1 Tax=Streptomyces xylophagus TaxID=285514 RepID=UPI0005BA90AF|nr:phage tail protein [Streptomyces xylophagus]